MRGGSAGSPSRGTPSRRGRSPRESMGTPGHGDILPTSKPNATFTTCLSIAVEGAVPIENNNEPVAAIPGRTVAASSGVTSRRAPRKSKTEALVALQNRDESPSPDIDDPFMHDSNDPPDVTPIPVPLSLDLSSVKTSSPQQPLPSSAPRPFGLQDCPTYYPSLDEFKDPMAYINSISREAARHGICKVVPPVGWRMPFVTDTETFRFKTRLQRLNSIEASSRAKINFLEQLYRFHKQQGNPRISVPSINHKPLDLWLLRKEVHKLGGYEAVTKAKQWADLGRILGYKGIPGLSTQIRNSYTRVILPYEHFCDHVRNSPALSPIKATSESQLRAALNAQTTRLAMQTNSSVTGKNGASGASSPQSRSSSPLSEPPDEAERRDRLLAENGKPRRRTRDVSLKEENDYLPSLASSMQAPITAVHANGHSESEPPKRRKRLEQSCEVCNKKNRGEEMLLCDGCDCGFHMFCLDPPLDIIPRGQWFCHTCLFGTGGDYGFDEGEEHSLSSFQARDQEFRRMWFTSHPPSRPSHPNESAHNMYGKIAVSEHDVEEEFWRLVQSQTDTVEIEYGADVHSTTHGTAMPTLETHPLDPYSKDPWNLSNIPILNQSLLRYIKSDISGMTVPWTYVGMVFSTFCWHNEDHYTYSINYMHWGETKTWYGIPGDDAEKFEAAIKQEAPDLFEAQPDLLYQLVTLMNPKRLVDAGVRVFACNQRAGEYVVTFPKAYHAGFNHGFNFNEAVNFALPDWLPLGLSCVQQYRDYRKHPVFSHDELLMTVNQHSESIKTALWLFPNLKEMVDREMKHRHVARALNLGEVLEEEDRPEEQYQCVHCKTLCYLSQVTCHCTKDVVCVDHIELLCQCPMHYRTLRKRFSDETLLETLATVGSRVEIPEGWRAKLGKTLASTARPELAQLRALLAEGEEISYAIPEVSVLRKCIARADQWVDSAKGFLVQEAEQQANDGKHLELSLERPNGTDYGLAHLHALLQDVLDLGFSCPEIEALTSLSKKAEDVRDEARALLDRVASDGREAHLQQCERFLEEHASLNVRMAEVDDVKKILASDQLIHDLQNFKSETASLQELQDLIARADACGFSPDDPPMAVLRRREQKGRRWMEHATQLLARPKTIEELEACIQVDSASTAIDPRILERLKSARLRADDFDAQAKLWMTADAVQNKPHVQDALRLVKRAEEEFILPFITDLKQAADFALDMESRCESVLKNTYQHREKTDVFEVIRRWLTYGRLHLAMFYMPQFEKLDRNVKLHVRWLEGLPWYCPQHNEAHGKDILDDVIESTKLEDDLPPSDEYYTCICTTAVRPPQQGIQSDAVQCDHCYARFHGACANKGRSCPFCDHRHWDGTMEKPRGWHFCYLPTMMFSAPEISKSYSEEWKQLEIIVHRIDRICGVIGQFLSFAGQNGNHRPEYIPQVRHFMRKLFKIQFVVSPNPEQSYGMDLASLHRVLAGQPAPVRLLKKRRRPKFSFGQDIDKDWTDGTRCICRGRTAYLLNYPTVQCETCSRIYHGGCVFFPADPSKPDRNRFICPLCCVRKGRGYQHAEVRVKDPEVKESDTYVNTPVMLDSFSKDILYCKMDPPYTKTLFVDLVKFTPGQPDHQGGAPLPPVSRQTVLPPPVVRPPMPPAPPPSHRPSHPAALTPHTNGMDHNKMVPAAGRHVPPPPPWAQGWAPPRSLVTSTSHASGSSLHSAPHAPRVMPPAMESLPPSPGPSRKRKSPSDIPMPEESLSSKRRSAPQTPVLHHDHPMQQGSPSLAKVLSPAMNGRPSPRVVTPSSHHRSLDLRSDLLPPRGPPLGRPPSHHDYAGRPRRSESFSRPPPHSPGFTPARFVERRASSSPPVTPNGVMGGGETWPSGGTGPS